MKVRVENYQTSLDTEFEIKGFTVVVGKSNTGKTALLRALEGSMFNDPVTGKVREGTKNTKVTVEFPDIEWVWEKGDSPPKYTVTTKDGTEVYSSLGRNVPQEIIDAGFWEWRSEDMRSRPQIASWYEPIFLLNKSPKVITELLAAVTRLDVVNLSIRKCSLYIRRKRNTLQVREEDLQKAEARAREFDALDDIDMLGLVAAHTEWEEAQGAIKQVQEYQVRLDNLDSRLEQFGVLDSVVLPDPLPTDDLSVAQKLSKWEKTYTGLNTRLAAMEVLDDVEIPVVELQADADALAAVDRYIAKLNKLDTDIDTLDKGEEKLISQIDVDVAHLDELRGSIDECPVCGRSG